MRSTQAEEIIWRGGFGQDEEYLNSVDRRLDVLIQPAAGVGAGNLPEYLLWLGLTYINFFVSSDS